MTKGHLISGLDIGTSSIKLLAVLKRPEEDNLEIISQAEIGAVGMRKGVVITPAKVAKKIAEVVEICQRGVDRKIESVFVNINGGHICFLPGRGLVSVSRADQKISETDIERALQASRAISLSANQEILDTFPQEFIIDGQPGVKEVEGLRGIRIEAKTLCLVVFSPYLKNLSDAILSAGLEIEHIMPSAIASAQAVLTPKEKELGVALVEIGAGTTTLAVFEEGTLAGAAVFPLGSDDITNDIAIVLKIEIEEAENIKKGFSGLGAKRVHKKSESEFSHKNVAKIIEARAKEICSEVYKELKKMGKTKLPAGVVLTGGGARLAKITDFAKKEMKLHCCLGLPKGFDSEINDPGWSTVCGLVLEAARVTEGGNQLSFIERNIFKKVKSIFKTFMP